MSALGVSDRKVRASQSRVVANSDRDGSNVIQGKVPQKLIQLLSIARYLGDEDEKSVLIYTVSGKATYRDGKPHLMQGCVEGWK